MKTIKIIFFYFFFGLSFLVRGQQIGNYVSNGSFEKLYDCNTPYSLDKAIHWSNIGYDSTALAGFLYSTGCLLNAPYTDVGFQYPRSGEVFYRMTPYCVNSCLYYRSRSYPKNRLKTVLISGKTYCVKLYANLENLSPYAVSNFGFYFGDNLTDTIKYANGPITYLTPQINNSAANIVTDTLNWIPIAGTFVATGNEKYLIFGNFESNSATTTSLVIPSDSIYQYSEYFIDDVSCIEVNLTAYAGPDKSVLPGDSVYIGRESDFAIDPGCIWYKLPNLTTSLDTISGIWVKPTTTSTYVVKQELDCSPLKWDTVVVFMNSVGLDKLQNLLDNISLFPNPTSGNLSISGFSSSDISSFCISNCLGQNVQSCNFIQKNNSIIIETSELESGLYQIHLKTQYGIVTKKFVKTN